MIIIRKKDYKEYIGLKINSLTIQYIFRDEKNQPIAHCLCDCGNEKDINLHNIKSNKSKSCGCGEIISRYQRTHYVDILGKKYGKLQVIKKTNEKYSNGTVKWICKCECGNIIKSNISNLKSGHTKSCGCDKSSKWELLIRNILIENNIKFEEQKRFNDCKNSQNTDMLPFDFYIEDLNTIIEYDGQHHFEPISYWGGNEKFLKTQENDFIKNEYCKKNNINLIRLPYTLKQDLITQIILNILESRNDHSLGGND